MYKSLDSIHKDMRKVLEAVRDEKFSLSELRANNKDVEIDEAIYACIEEKLITGINAGRSAETGHIMFYPSENIKTTYKGLSFLETH